MNKLLYILMAIAFLGACGIKENTMHSEMKKQSGVAEATKAENYINVDVRTPEEYQYDGHAQCSVNIPLNQLGQKIVDLSGYEKINLVCRSGNRAERAKQILAGRYPDKQINNLGAWQNLECNNE
jgi:rhodanese-related sulfurtransferase